MKFKPGIYYIGDPCYAIQGDDWDQILNETDFFQNEKQTWKGKQIFASDTAYGDGTYLDQFKNEYPVDAGLIGIMPIEICDFGEGITYKNGKWSDTRGIPNFTFQPGNVFEFKEEFEVDALNGKFQFGHVFIDTDPEPDESEYDNDDEYWENYDSDEFE